MEKYLTPAAIVLAALIGSFTFRFEAQPLGSSNHMMMVHDRWTGVAKYCGGRGEQAQRFPFLSAGLIPARR